MKSNWCIAGIDGGGSKTECAIVDQAGHILGIGKSGPSREPYVTSEESRQAVIAAIEEALASAGSVRVAMSVCTHRFDERAEIKESIIRLLGADVRGFSEGEAALGCVGMFKRVGIAHIAGTGTSTWGYPGDGSEILQGGWGPLLGDEGGGYDIALKGLRAAVRTLDGLAPETRLLDLACSHYGIEPDRISILKFIMARANRHVIASFAPLVTKAAREGDEAACKIVDAAIIEHTESILGMVRKLFNPNQQFPVALHGGVMSDEGISDKVTSLVKEQFPLADIRLPVNNPAVGLALFALHNN